MKNFFPIQKSILSRKAIENEILSLYSLSSNYTCRFINHGCNDTYEISDRDNKYYLRIYRNSWRNKKEEIIAEIDLLNYLKDCKSISIATPVKKNDNGFITEINAPEGIRYAILFNSAIGKLKKINVKRCFNYGRMLAQIHKQTDKISLNKDLKRFDIDLHYLLDEPLDCAKEFFNRKEKEYIYLKDIAEKLKNKIKENLPKVPPFYGICHGDIHDENAFFNKNDKPCIFDFDCFGYGWRSYDIASFLRSLIDDRTNYWQKKQLQKEVKDLFKSFLKGYSQVRELSKEELESIYIFVLIRKIWGLGFCAKKCDDIDCPWFNDSYIDNVVKFIKKWNDFYKIVN